MKSATDLRAEASAHRQEAYDSFERCDTDGFLSQWAHGLSAELKTTQAAILEAGGKATFIGLYDGDRRVPARLVLGRFPAWAPKSQWMLRDAADIAKYGRKFIPEGDRSKVQKALGLAEKFELAPADAKLEGRGTGLSGTCWVQQYRTGCLFGTDATLKPVQEPSP